MLKQNRSGNRVIPFMKPLPSWCIFLADREANADKTTTLTC